MQACSIPGVVLGQGAGEGVTDTDGVVPTDMVV